MKKILIISLIIILIAIIAIFCTEISNQNKKVIKIAFLGDSITEYGWDNENGYVKQTVEALKQARLNIEPIPAGVCGDSTRDMLNRLDEDVLDKNPDVVFFMGGINDVWWNKFSIEEFKNNVETIIDKVKQKGAKIIIISITVLTEDLNSAENQTIDEYNNCLKEITKQKDVQYIDANTIFKKEIQESNSPENILTIDGVHLNDRGNKLLADIIVKEFLKEKLKNQFFRKFLVI